MFQFGSARGPYLLDGADGEFGEKSIKKHVVQIIPPMNTAPLATVWGHLRRLV